MVQCCCKTLYTRRSAFNTATTFSGRTSPRIMPLPLVGQELAHVGDPDAVALRMLHPLQIHPEVNGAHDAIAELLVDQRLYGGAVDLRNLVNPVDGGIHRNVGVERSAHGDLLQRRRDLCPQPEHVAGCLRLFGAHWVLPKQGGSGPYLVPPDLLCELRKREPVLALRFEDPLDRFLPAHLTPPRGCFTLADKPRHTTTSSSIVAVS